MEQAKTVRLKIFLWDQLIRPVYLLLNIHQLQALLLALLILNFVVWKSIWGFWVLSLLLAVIFIYQITQYYKSGEFMHNYRKYKSDKGEYADYRKATKILKKDEVGKALERTTKRISEQNPDWQADEINTGYCKDCGKELYIENGGNWTCDCQDKKDDKEVKEDDGEEERTL